MTIKVKLENRTLEVKKLPLGKYADLLKALQKLPAQLNLLSGANQDELIAKIPLVIGESLPDFFGVFKVATDITDQELEEIGLSEAVDIFIAIMEVNQFQEVYQKIKKAVARFQKPEIQGQKTGSIPQ